MFDTIIRNGTVHDGTGAPGRRADVAIRDGLIAAVGVVEGAATNEIDATGCIVTPGFVDPHTHYDGQAIWSSRMNPSSANGVTTVVIGNCGVGFAPCKAADRALLVSAMEGVEDIPGVVMAEGLDWRWETFGQFMDALEARPHDIDIGVFLPHSPLRVYVMGARGAEREAATDADIAQMAELARAGVAAGALGISTSRVDTHRRSDGEYIPSHNADMKELLGIMRGARAVGPVLFQLVPETLHPTEAAADAEIAMLETIARDADCAVTFTLAQVTNAPARWRRTLELVRAANARGVVIRPQIFPRPVGMLLGHSVTLNPFSLCPSFAPLEALPFDERIAELRKPEVRARLVPEAPANPHVPLVRFTRMFERMYPFRTPDYEPRKDDNLVAIAAREGRTAAECAYDLMLEDGGKALILTTIANYSEGSLDTMLEMIRHPDTVIGLGDGGAHYGMICDASYTTFVLTHWSRDRDGERIALPDAIRMLTSEPAALLGLGDRGLIAPGLRADINVIDYDRLAIRQPTIVQDLPSGGKRIDQRADGYRCTMVAGEVIARDGVPTGALPGRLVRGPRRAAAPASADVPELVN